MSRRLYLKNSNKDDTLQDIFIYKTWKNIKQNKKNNNKLKIIGPKWNDEFGLSDGSHSVPDIQDYIEYIVKNMKHYPLTLLFIFTSTRLKKDFCSNTR